MSIPNTSFEVVKLGRELSLANVALRAHLGQATPPKREAQGASKTSGANLAEASSAASELAEFRKRQWASNESVQELTA